MRTLIGGSLVLLTLALSACGGSSSSSASDEALQRDSDLYAISQIEKSFHEAITKKDIDEMMSLYAPNATAHVRAGQTVSGKDADPGGLAQLGWRSSPTTNWLSDHPAYKLKATVNGDRGTLRFECHFVDLLDTRKIAAVTAGSTRRRPDRRPLADHQLRRKHRRAEALSTVSPANAPQQGLGSRRRRRRLLSPADNPLVRAVGRLPAGVHAKLLVAFVGTALLVVVLGVLGLRLLGQSNERVETLGTLQQRAFAYGKLQSDALHVRTAAGRRTSAVTTTRSSRT